MDSEPTIVKKRRRPSQPAASSLEPTDDEELKAMTVKIESPENTPYTEDETDYTTPEIRAQTAGTSNVTAATGSSFKNSGNRVRNSGSRATVKVKDSSTETSTSRMAIVHPVQYWMVLPLPAGIGGFSLLATFPGKTEEDAREAARKYCALQQYLSDQNVDDWKFQAIKLTGEVRAMMGAFSSRTVND